MKLTSHWYDRDGIPIDNLEDIERLLRDPDYKILKRTNVHEWQVSTVWLGLDHSFCMGSRPLIFETMVFRRHPMGDGIITGEDYDMDRYATEAEALKGHEEMVNKWRIKSSRWWWMIAMWWHWAINWRRLRWWWMIRRWRHTRDKEDAQ